MNKRFNVRKKENPTCLKINCFVELFITHLAAGSGLTGLASCHTALALTLATSTIHQGRAIHA
jgi:hypothetical protein